MPGARRKPGPDRQGRVPLPEPAPPPWQRLDKWLWCARFLRTRSACTRFVLETPLRINRAPVSGPDQRVRVGDVLTLVINGRVLVWRVLALAARRGPPAEAARLYECLEEGSPFPEGGAESEEGKGGSTEEEVLLHCEKDRRISPASRSGEMDQGRRR